MRRHPVLNDAFPGFGALTFIGWAMMLWWPWYLWAQHGHAWGWAALGVLWDLLTVPIAIHRLWQYMTRT